MRKMENTPAIDPNLRFQRRPQKSRNEVEKYDTLNPGKAESSPCVGNHLGVEPLGVLREGTARRRGQGPKPSRGPLLRRMTSGKLLSYPDRCSVSVAHELLLQARHRYFILGCQEL
ncbi:hypothetical protein J5N97_003169 [Dioscorea zingiberensis]|uniref:Uncharacterized protein n=1 Tax=Dioscorea zingiberensis TaxID=325984 RepID=A0A9D5HQ68_9LILI|nr:hypothetical protein J5N97_003169 [Dioscorea zingiberensis]